jgi:hypothetical protein
MRLLIPLCTSLLLLALQLDAQVVLKRDNDKPTGHDSTALADWEETMMLVPAGPASLEEIYIYFDGTAPGKDTIWIVGDPAEGSLSPTSWVWSYNALTDPIVIDYDGTPGWDTIDVRSRGLHYDGYDRIVIQHRVKENGPWFAVDNGVASPLSSFEYDPTTINSLGFPGNYFAARGDFLVRALITYDFPKGTGSQAAPTATLHDVAKSVGLTDSAGKPLKSARVSVADWNGDGWDDIEVGGSFFQNRGNGTFVDVTQQLGIVASTTSWGDIDNDGDIDCYAVNGGAGDRIYRNNGDGTFSDITAATKIANPAPTVTPIWLDYDHDGRLDLFIANGRTEDSSGETYFQDQLWHQESDGTFRNTTAGSGIPAAEPDPYYDCWAASAADYDRDTWPDIFVATYRLAPDLLYQNQRDGTFRNTAVETGTVGVPTVDPQYFGHGAGCDWGDFDNDGDLDLMVGNLGHPDWRGQVSNPSLLFRNDGPPAYHFTEIHRQAGIKFFEMNFGVVWLDLDLDGYLDLWHCQYAYNAVGSNGEPRRLSRMYLNEGPTANYHFKDITWSTGPLIHGAWTAARLDFDRDGDMDLVVASPTDAVKLFRNDVPKRGHSIGIRLVGRPNNLVSMDAYGSVVRVYAGGKVYMRDLPAGGGGTTGTQQSNLLNFGIGDATTIDKVEITYSNGQTRTVTGLMPGHEYRIGMDGSILSDVAFSGVEVTGVAGQTIGISSPSFDGDGFRFFLAGPEQLGSMTAEVVDALGRVIAGKSWSAAAPGMVSLSADGTIPNGAYLIRVVTGKGSAVTKLAVMR